MDVIVSAYQILVYTYFVGFAHVLFGVLFFPRDSRRPRLKKPKYTGFGVFMLLLSGFVPFFNALLVIVFAVNYDRIMDDYRK